ncbi:transposable element Tcb2 transposase [Trichonephila clavipes]|nr:transposable element Tcb2 transposase [Trichonephila clavipes]
MGAVGADFISMDDNTRPPRAYMVNEFLEKEDIPQLDWPVRSPDLIPTKYAWATQGRATVTLNPLWEPS